MELTAYIVWVWANLRPILQRKGPGGVSDVRREHLYTEGGTEKDSFVTFASRLLSTGGTSVCALRTPSLPRSPRGKPLEPTYFYVVTINLSLCISNKHIKVGA
eukprot:scaffold178499_cov30-Tisochrysis_lutea.AAC.2